MAADEAPNGQAQTNWDAVPGQVGERSAVAAMDTRGVDETQRAASGAVGGADHHGDALVIRSEELELEPRGIRNEGGHESEEPFLEGGDQGRGLPGVPGNALLPHHHMCGSSEKLPPGRLQHLDLLIERAERQLKDPR
jgi:hypothetical protein